ncbi:MAG: hypothetical protein OXH23_16925 [bacterium]|nr:hypothetical protein [bacterium]
MSDPRSSQVTLEDVMATAALIDLPLSHADAQEVADLLSAWMPGAVALSTRMQSVQELMPAQTFNSTTGMAPHELVGATG